MKKFLAMLLSMTMVLCMIPTMAFAADGDGDATPQEVTAQVEIKDTPTDGFYPWTGNPIVPALTVTVTPTDGSPDTVLTSSDYFVTYTNQTGPGEATATVTLDPTKYTVTNPDGLAVKFSIKKNISALLLEKPTSVLAGTTVAISEIKLIDNGTALSPSTDYQFEGDNDTFEVKEGNTSAVIVGTGTKYFGERTVDFTLGTDLSTAVIADFTLTYTGKEQPVSPTVTIGTKCLTKDVDYKVTIDKKVINAGDYTLTIVGIGKYAGTVTKTFTVKPKNLDKVSIPAIENQTTTSHPTLKIMDGDYELIVGTDYTMESQVIGASGTVTIKGIGNYTGTVERPYKIKDEINASDFTLNYTKRTYTYTGYAITPEISITSKKSGTTFVLNRDYKIVGGGKVDAGTYPISLVGINNYGGVIYEGSYTISQANLYTDGSASLSGTEFVYTGKEIAPSATVTCGGRVLRKDTDYTVTYLNNKYIGAATAIITGKGNYTGSITKNFQIIGKSVANLSATLSQSSYTYDGLEKKPTVTLYDGTKKLTSGVDYTVAYRNNKNAGTAEVLITGKGSYGGTKTVTFRIVGKDQTVTTKYTHYAKTLASKPFNLYADHSGDGTLVYRTSDPKVATVSATGTVTIKGTGRAIITVSTAGNIKYEPASKEVTVTVKPGKPASLKLTTAGKKQIKVTFAKVDGATKYQVRYGRNGNYSIKTMTHKESAFPKTYTYLKNRVSGKTYYIKVRAYKELADGTRIYGEWTATKKLKAK